MRAHHKVELITRVGCHLCDDAKEVLMHVRQNQPFEYVETDVDTDPALVEAYGMEVPVVLVDGRKHAKFRVDEQALRRRLAEEA